MSELRVLLDTNIYGLIVVDPMRKNILNNIIEDKKIIIYGNQVIRKELRKKSKGKVDGINLRMDLLRAYDDLVGTHEININKTVEELAEQYFQLYTKFGGSIAKRKMMSDFTIVASASHSNLNIVVSEDNNTMLSEIAIKAYNAVNTIRKIHLPRFYGYEKFKKMVKN